MHLFDKRILNFFIIIILSLLTFTWTYWIFHKEFQIHIVATVIIIRLIASMLIYKDFSLSWSKASQKTFLIKSAVYIIAFAVYMPIFYKEERIHFFISELFFYLFTINFFMYAYYYYRNTHNIKKTKEVSYLVRGELGLNLKKIFLLQSIK